MLRKLIDAQLKALAGPFFTALYQIPNVRTTNRRELNITCLFAHSELFLHFAVESLEI